jgi:Predicted RNA-binding protein, contains TRAM domain
MELLWIGGAVGVAVVVLLVAGRRRGSGDAAESQRAHEAARERPPPVEIGATYEFGVTDFSDHHSGDRVAVGKVQGFVVFTEDVPSSLSTGAIIRAKITSFNRGNTSADAIYVGRV